MKRKLQFTLVAIAGLIYGQNLNAQVIDQTAQTVTYDFESTTGTPLANLAFPGAGTLEAVPASGLTDNGTANTSTVIRPLTWGTPNQTGVVDLSSFPSTSNDYSVTWKEYIAAGTTFASNGIRKGYLLRANGSSTYTTGMQQGYYFLVRSNPTNVTFRILNSNGTTVVNLPSEVAVTIPGYGVDKAIWYRASVVKNGTSTDLKFEYSTDGSSWSTGNSFTDANNLHTAGGTQLVYGIGQPAGGWIHDDVVYKNLGTSINLGVNSVSFDEKSIVAFKKGNTININSSEMTIKSVQLFDINGQLIASINNINASETSFSHQTFGHGVILAKITGTDDKEVTRKLLY